MPNGINSVEERVVKLTESDRKRQREVSKNVIDLEDH
jgi:hypothetical protein